MSNFKPLPNRDASHIIRGYVYQVNFTILRWLELKDGQFLELECGEDIDVISKSLRENQQVKHRESKLTLNNSSVLDAICNAYVTFKNNPNLDICFRFVSNCDWTTEKKQLFNNGQAAILIWKQIQEGKIDKADKYLGMIRRHLRSCKKPSKTKNIRWGEFKNYLKTVSLKDFARFVEKFIWSLRSHEFQELEDEINHVLSDKIGITLDEAKEKYQKLFCYTFKLLCEKGLKRLGSKELNKILILPVTAYDKQEYKKIIGELNSLRVDIKAIKRGVEKNTSLLKSQSASLNGLHNKSDMISGMFEDFLGDLKKGNFNFASTGVVGNDSNKTESSLEVQSLLNEQQLKQICDSFQKVLSNQLEQDFKVTSNIARDYYTLPPRLEKQCERKKTVDDLSTQADKTTLLAVHGTSGTGKSNLALLIAEKHLGNKIWLNFKGEKQEDVSLKLDNRLKDLLKDRGVSDFHQLFATFNEGSIIILDDMPRIVNGDKLSQLLRNIIVRCNENQIRIILTSNYQLPTTFISDVGEDYVANIEIPTFTKEDCIEALRLYGAPDKLLESADFISVATQGHPTLVISCIKYLEDKSWILDSNSFDDIFKNKYAKELEPEIIDKLLSTIPPESRDMLYRLLVVISTFTIDDIESLAKVEPEIQRSSEYLRHIDGLWIQKIDNDNWTLSPLLKTLSDVGMSEDKKKELNFALVKRILSKGQINQKDASDAIIYSMKAKQVLFACNILIQTLVELNRVEELEDDRFLGLYWANSSLPNELFLSLKIYLRALQVSVNYKLKRDTSYILDDFKGLVSLADDNDSWALLGAATVLCQNADFAKENLDLLNEITFKGIKGMPNAKLPDGSIIEFPESELGHVTALALNPLIHINSPKAFTSWLANVKKLGDEAIEKMNSAEIVKEILLSCCDSIWLTEHNKSEKLQDWNKVLDFYKQVAREAWEMKFYLLWGCAVRSQIVIAAEYLESLDDAVIIATESIDMIEGKNEDSAEYLIKQIIGCQYYYQKKYPEGEKYLKEATEYDGLVNPQGKLRAFHYLGVIYSEESSEKACEYSKKAVDYAKNIQFLNTSLEVVRAIGELAISRWLNGEDYINVYEDFDEAVRCLFEKKKDDIFWKSLFMQFGHCCGYFAKFVKDGEGPEQTRDGSVYAKPFRGVFFAGKEEERAELYNELNIAYYYTNMASFACGIKRYDDAYNWAQKGIAIAKETRPIALISLVSSLIPNLLSQGKYKEIVEREREKNIIALALKEAFQDHREILNATKSDFDKIKLEDLPIESKNEIEYGSSIVLILILFQIMHVSVESFEEANESIKKIADICKVIDSQSYSEGYWLEISEMFLLLQSKEKTINEILDFAGKYSNEKSIITDIGYVGLALFNNAPLATILKGQLCVLPRLPKLLYGYKELLEEVVFSFVEKYWANVLENRGFDFRNIILVRKEFNNALNRESEKRIKEIFKAIRFGINIRVEPQISLWLNSD